MICPKCNSARGRVVDSGRIDDGWATRRRRQCESCGFRFTTYERIDTTELPKILPCRGAASAYDESRVIRMLTEACAKLPVAHASISRVADRITEIVVTDGRRIIPSEELCQWIANELGKLHEVARVRFELKWKRPADAADCLVILIGCMKRHLGL